MKPGFKRGICHFALSLWALAVALPSSAAERNYTNPILDADYSDPDVIRVDKSYYLVASTFHFSPGLPVLKSNDLVHWTIISHVLPTLNFAPEYDLPGPVPMGEAGGATPAELRLVGQRYGRGVWAPAIRWHAGLFYVYFPTPDEGIFVATARDPAGPWSAPAAIIKGAGLEDPCPFWDDDGRAYLIHSRTGAGPLIVHRMSADGRSVLDAGTLIVRDPMALPTLEGPKLYKRDGYYYIFAPFGGVGVGSQTVLRSRSIWGPYEHRTVLTRGATSVQAPHQGAWVETPSGQGWFIHFNSTGGYGRITYLEPVQWHDDWPLIGEPIEGSSAGEPVSQHAAPDVEGEFVAVAPQTSDEFSSPMLGLQWEWNHNPDDTRWSLSERPGWLRLKSAPATDLLSARNTLTQVQQGEATATTARLDIVDMVDGQRAGLAMFGFGPSWIGVVQHEGVRHLLVSVAGAETEGQVLISTRLQLRLTVKDQIAHYAYSLDEGRSFTAFGPPAPFRFSWWKGARPALFTYNSLDQARPGIVDVDWVHIEPLQQVAPSR